MALAGVDNCAGLVYNEMVQSGEVGMAQPTLTPLHLQILLWYHTRPVKYAEYEPQHANSIATTNFTGQLVAWGMIEPVEGVYYCTTAKGIAYIEYVLALPLPKQCWVMP
jgi:hypothetical protein